MDFIEALKKAKKIKAGLRPTKWRQPFDDYDGSCNLTDCAYRPRRYYNRWYLDLCVCGTLRTSGAPQATLHEINDLLGEWDVVTEEELNAAYKLKMKSMRSPL